MTPQQLRTEIKRTADQLESFKRQLDAAERQCQHDWAKTEYVPDHQEGYRIPSDREMGLEMGVDSRPACYVAAKTTPKWKRTCKKCDKTEITTRTKKQYASGAIPGTGGQIDVPDFGDRY